MKDSTGEWLDKETLDRIRRRGIEVIDRCPGHGLLLHLNGPVATIVISPLAGCLCEEAAQDLSDRLVNDARALAVIIGKRTWMY